MWASERLAGSSAMVACLASMPALGVGGSVCKLMH